MVAICHDDPPSQDGNAPPDKLRRVVHILLALYLLPAFLLVMLLGGALLAIQGVAQVMGAVRRSLGRLRQPSESRRDDPTRSPRSGGRRLVVAPVRIGARLVNRAPRT